MTETKKRGRKSGVKTTPENETKAEKFIRLGNKRLNKSLKAIEQIKNLSSNAYESKPEQVDYIINKLTKAVEDIKNAFIATPKQEAEKTEIPV